MSRKPMRDGDEVAPPFLETDPPPWAGNPHNDHDDDDDDDDWWKHHDKDEWKHHHHKHHKDGDEAYPDRAFVFLPPPLITLVMAALLASLFLRGRLVKLDAWLGSRHGVLVNVSHALTLIALFFASAQAFNSVLPEQGLLHWMFAFFFLWTLWNDQFSAFDPRRLLRSLGVLFGTAFVLKHMIMAGLSAPGGSWTRRLAGMVFEGLSLGTLDVPAVSVDDCDACKRGDFAIKPGSRKTNLAV